MRKNYPSPATLVVVILMLLAVGAIREWRIQQQSNLLAESRQNYRELQSHYDELAKGLEDLPTPAGYTAIITDHGHFDSEVVFDEEEGSVRGTGYFVFMMVNVPADVYEQCSIGDAFEIPWIRTAEGHVVEEPELTSVP